MAPTAVAHLERWADKMRALLIALFLSNAVHASLELIEHHPQRELIVRSLNRRAEKSAIGATHHFYFLRRGSEDWVYWREGGEIWRTTLEPYYESKGRAEIRARAVWDLRLYGPSRVLDLEHDVVATESDLRPLDWRVTRAFVEQLLSDFATQGEIITITRKAANQVPEPASGLAPGRGSQ
jgi:hypothetical protein